jgi:hypothetical protein
VRKITALALGVLVVALAGSTVAIAHTFTASTRISAHKLPAGTTAAGAPVIIYGRVRSDHPLCLRDRAVRLKRVVTPGPDLILAVTYTNRLGRYYFVRHPTRSQTVYVSVRRLDETSAGHSHTCFGSRSKNRVIDVS